MAVLFVNQQPASRRALDSFANSGIPSRSPRISAEKPQERMTSCSSCLDSLLPKDREMLELRMDGKTLEEIAKEFGYSNHSGVLKRLRKIGEVYKAYAAKE